MPSSLADVERLLATAEVSGRTTASPQDWRDCPIYFLMVDRFANDSQPPRQPWNDPTFAGYQGGTFRGIQRRLDYIKQLGFGAIWLSPVLRNAAYTDYDTHSYHGYGIIDFLSADPRFAEDPDHADDELRELVDAAHAAGLAVILDIVLNHTGDVFAYQCEPGDDVCQQSHGAKAGFSASPKPVSWRNADGSASLPSIEGVPGADPRSLVWPVELQREAYFRKQGMASDVVGDFETLKQLLTADPRLQQVLIRCYQYLIARFDIDGFRIDTLRFLQGDLPRLFGNAMREFALAIGKRNFFTFGEVWADEEQIARFIGRTTSDRSDLVGVDAALDFPLMYTLNSVGTGFAPPSALVAMYALRKEVEREVLSSHGDASRFFVSFITNHDIKERARYRAPDGSHPYDQQVYLRLAALASLPGIPCLYYGTEQGLDGRGSDEAVREALWGGPGFDQGSSFYVGISEIMAVRAARAALRYGRLYFRPVSLDGVAFSVPDQAGGVLAYSRILADEEIVVVANTSTSASVRVDVITDQSVTPVGTVLAVLYSNAAAPGAVEPVRQLDTVSVTEVDGSHGSGPLNACRLELAPMEIKILGRVSD